jgi:gamma-glutamyl-gamma-aminobutyrate hydrolase PuuD
MPLTVGLTQRMEWLEGRGEMRQAIDVAWCAGLVRAGALPTPLPMRGADPGSVLTNYRVDVLLLTGGNEARDDVADRASQERNTFERALLRAARDARMPVLAICHGMQLLNVFLGGRLSPATGHVRGEHILAVRSPGLLDARVNSYHDVAVQPNGLAPDLVSVAQAEDGTVEAAVHRRLPWLALMWHPERAMPDGRDGMALIARYLREPSHLCEEMRGGAQ